MLIQVTLPIKIIIYLTLDKILMIYLKQRNFQEQNFLLQEIKESGYLISQFEKCYMKNINLVNFALSHSSEY